MGIVPPKYDFSFKRLMLNEETDPVDDWIRLLNAETEEELDVIKTINPGILEAIREVKVMSLRKNMRALYEAHMKELRDRNARDEYVREEGKKEGKIEGKAEGRIEGRTAAILQLLCEKGTISQKLKEEICGQSREDILSEWLSIAAHAESVEEFVQKVGTCSH